MSKTAKSEFIRGRFLEELRNLGIGADSPKDLRQRLNLPVTAMNAEVYLTEKGFLNVHVISDGKGFWGLTANVIETLKAWDTFISIPFHIVLLKGRLEDDLRTKRNKVADGYVFPKISDLLTCASPTASGDSYKINEGSIPKIHALIPTVQLIAKAILDLPDWSENNPFLKPRGEHALTAD